MIAYRLHLEPANLHLVDRVQSGALGDLRVFTSTFALQVAEDDVRLISPDQGGGPLYDIGVYCINAARYLFRAEPEAVWATPVAREQPRFHDIEEAVSCVMRFPGERLATFTCSFGAHDVSLLTLVGDEGSLRMDNAFKFQGDRHLEQEGGHDPGTRTFAESDQFGPQLEYFSRCIVEGGDLEPNGEEGLVDVRIIRALYESMDTGWPVELDLERASRPVPDMAVRHPALESPEMVDASSSSA
jgi:glucose-fructose oxidoreductase